MKTENTIKIQVPITPRTEEREIKLPAYFKDGICHWYKIFSPHQCIQATLGGKLSTGITSIGVHSASLAISNDKCFQCTEEEFTRAFNDALNQLKEAL